MGVCYGTPVFPTTSFTSYLKSGMKSTISSSSSSAAGNSHDLVGARSNQAFRDGENLAEPNLTVFSFVELKKAIKNFRADLLLGEGGFGYVYKGMLHGRQRSGRTKTVIAVERLKQHSVQGYGEWPVRTVVFIFLSRRINEDTVLGRLSHPNLAKLLGYCRKDENLALVYEFMPKGSLDKHLFRKGSTAHLPWDVRVKIAVGPARGLAFLRSSEKKLIHGYFKTSKILLDESYLAKLTDFGLVRSGHQEDGTHVTCAYAAPENLACGVLIVKSDIYCFGVMSLEILTGLMGQTTVIQSKKKRLMDSELEGNYSMHSAFQIAQLALECLQAAPHKQPSMTEVMGDWNQ
ncbi:hypothetical protein EUGRSUZ_L02282 [Eucalyptus grandis]|uniref:Protein kinase domain-containing protein n=1 Tax=Eucalyptus grandis TaxID=71139 RepID=A0A058ZTA7_EUCGR|nr:hypothetical protein EUGRSUZ_L02282 [Eucalyptus grandis]